MSKGIFVRWSAVYTDKLSVKVTNTMTMREIRNHVVEKRRLQNPEDYALEFNGKPVDLNTTVMAMNLQQGAKLDLVKSFVQSSQDSAFVTLELESGGKITERVPISMSLYDTLVHFQTQLKSPGKFTQPSRGKVVLFHGGKEFHSEEHLKLTFQALGVAVNANVTIGVAFRDETAEGVVSQPFVPLQIPSSQQKRKESTSEVSLAPSSQSPTPSSESSSTGSLDQLDSKGKGKAKAKESSLTTISQADIPADREIQVFGAPTQVRDLTEYEVPEEMYELDKSDLIRLQISSEKNKKEETLKTKAMREEEERQKRAKHSKTTIRVKLPDQVVVQGIFSPDEPVSALYQWVRSVMKDPQDFELFVTPPRRVLPENNTGLYHLGLVPSAVVFLAWKDAIAASVQPLKDHLYEQKKELQVPEFMVTKEESSSKAEEAVLRRLKHQMEGKQSEEKSSGSSGGALPGNQGKTIPKWFKS